jgi:cell division protein FtsB
MAVASYSPRTAKRTRSRKSGTGSTHPPKNTKQAQFSQYPVSPKPPSRKVERLKLRARPLPLWVRSLLMLQRSSSAIVFCLIVSTLALYAWTVYIPRLWSKEYKKLETLHRHERQLIATNETLKNQLAQQAERPETGLANPNPAHAIFLAPTSVSPQSQPKPLAPSDHQSSVTAIPLAY